MVNSCLVHDLEGIIKLPVLDLTGDTYNKMFNTKLEPDKKRWLLRQILILNFVGIYHCSI